MHPRIEIYFSMELFYLNRIWLISSCFLVFLCLCNDEREIKSFSLFVNLPAHGNGRFCVLKLVATSRRECAREGKTRTSGSGAEYEVKEKVNDFQNVTSVRNFSGIFLTMHLASCYSFRHTLNSCFVLCCKQFLKKMQSVCV